MTRLLDRLTDETQGLHDEIEGEGGEENGGLSGHDQLHGFLRHLPYVDLLCVKLGGDTL